MPGQKYLGAFRISCPSCHRVVYYERWEGKPEVTKTLSCPCCGASLGVTGTVDSVAVLSDSKVICVSSERQRETGGTVCGPDTCPPVSAPISEPKDIYAYKEIQMPKHPIYRAEDYPEVFMYDEFGRLRWFPNPETLHEYGYTTADVQVQPISWFYDKPIVESIRDTKTKECYPAEQTPNYQAYRSPAWGLPPPEAPVEVAAFFQALKSPEWWKKYGVWVGIGVVSTVLLVVLVVKK